MDSSIVNTCLELAGPVRPLALYSHLLPIFVSLILGYFVFRLSNKQTSSVLFAVFTLLLSVWLAGDLITWHSNNYYAVAAFWSTLDFLNILFYLVLACFFIVQTLRKPKLASYLALSAIVIATPPLLLTIAGIAVTDFDETNCEMAGNDLLALYKLVVEWASIAVIGILGLLVTIRNWRDSKYRNQVLVLTISTVTFLGIFSGSEYIATATDVYEVTLYALFSLPIFLVILTYTIVEQGTFKLRGNSFILARLLFFIFILVASFNLVLADDRLEFLITCASTIVTIGFGLLLLRGARREMQQREQIEKLAHNLEKANSRLRELDKQKSEFVSVASHQLRSPLAAIRGYASMLVEGSYGAIDPKAVEPLSRIADSAKLMAESVEDFLSVSRIEGGNMKYEYSNFNINEQAERITEDLRPEGFKKGLLLLFKSDIKSTGIVHADQGKVQQIIHNLINNSLKYTPRGTITVHVYDDTKSKHLHIDIVDTGIGMSKDTIDSLFAKFTRAKNANAVNIKGTGLGLFVAREMARAMGGDITAHSEGEGKGSRFEFVIPTTM
jgi:signal transduction histidine kinase